MLVGKAVQLAMLTAALLWEGRADAATSAFKVCGRKLGDIMARVCHTYNSPTWDIPTVVEQAAATVRRRRQTGGIADECCIYGCTWEQLTEYCSVSANSESVLDGLDIHMIADRSAESDGAVAAAASSVPAQVAQEARDGVAESRREVGRARRRGYGRARRGRSRRCRCRRKHRADRRRASLMGNMDAIRSAPRAAPVVGTVSPLLTWGRTLYTDLPALDRDRYAYVAVYST